mmetsp:Transcript_54540/g.130102  ORF Transcript_54540/g.130102 Transcript_54540/m.130102 type:complete len:221 (-) Transcript_54540:211-873(-)
MEQVLLSSWHPRENPQHLSRSTTYSQGKVAPKPMQGHTSGVQQPRRRFRLANGDVTADHEHHRDLKEQSLDHHPTKAMCAQRIDVGDDGNAVVQCVHEEHYHVRRAAEVQWKESKPILAQPRSQQIKATKVFQDGYGPMTNRKSEGHLMQPREVAAQTNQDILLKETLHKEDSPKKGSQDHVDEVAPQLPPLAQHTWGDGVLATIHNTEMRLSSIFRRCI